VEAFEVSNVLSPEECAECLERRTSDFERSSRFNRFSGKRERTCYMDEITASKLFQRLAPFIEDLRHQHFDEHVDDYNFVGEAHHDGVTSGLYVPCGVNPFLRVSRYAGKGSFRLHTDTGYARLDSYVGFWTLLVYLSDDFEGGKTTVYKFGSKQDEHELKPEVGKVFAFFHYQLHAGMPVICGTRLVTRTERTFRK